VFWKPNYQDDIKGFAKQSVKYRRDAPLVWCVFKLMN